MDAHRFDHMVKALSASGARRWALHLLVSLPLVAGVASLLGEEESAAGRRKRRRKQHPQRNNHLSAAKKRKNQKKKHKKRKKQCSPESSAQTCADRCGSVQNNCQQSVDCGSCACDPPCPVCQVCGETSDACEPDPDQRGDACGEPGQVCQADGACSCDGDSCGGCATCQSDGFCSESCNGTGCCDGGICFAGDTNAICGAGGGVCMSCTPPETCGGGGTPGVCGCTPTNPCAAGACGTIQNNCGQNVNCGSCSNPTPICVSHVCTACTSADQCPSGQMCDAGSCVACDVCASGCSFSSIQAAIDAASAGATIRICPGTYGRVNVNKNLTLIGSGDGDNAASNTILNGSSAGTTLQFNGVIAAAKGLRITGGLGSAGGGIFNAATSTLTNCTVTGNTSTISGGGVYNAGGGMNFFGCTISTNTAPGLGGGIYTNGFVTIDNTDVTGNTAGTGNSGGGIYSGSGTVTLQNGSTITGNSPNNCVGSISGSGCGS